MTTPMSYPPILSRVLLPLSLALVLPAAGGETGTIRFANNDQLSGELLALDTERLNWSSPILREPQEFWISGIAELRLPGREPDLEVDHEATLTLRNGDRIRGQLAAVDMETIELDTWYAGRLSFRRVMVESLMIGERPTFFYRGPEALDEWTQPSRPPSWTFQGSALRASSTGVIGREIETEGDNIRFGFDVEWRGNLRVNCVLFADTVERENVGAGYELSIQQRFMNLRRRDTGMTIGSAANVMEIQELERIRLEISVQRSTGTFLVHIDERLVAFWRDPDVGTGMDGNGLVFNNNVGLPVALSNIEVSTWDGQMDDLPDPDLAMGNLMGNVRIQGNIDGFALQQLRGGVEIPDPAQEEESREGRMLLRNGDSLAGEASRIEDGTIHIDTPLGQISLPVARLRSINLPAADLERPKLMNGDVRCWFPDGTSVVFRLDSTEDGKLTGYSQTFGTASFDFSAFSRIEFNIHDPDRLDPMSVFDW